MSSVKFSLVRKLCKIIQTSMINKNTLKTSLFLRDLRWDILLICSEMTCSRPRIVLKRDFPSDNEPPIGALYVGTVELVASNAASVKM